MTLRDRAAYLADADALVVADLHVGRDEAAAVEFPLGERADLRDRLAALLAHFAPSQVVFAGDVLHSFEGPTVAAAESLAALAETCRTAGADAVLVAGNHDVHLGDCWDGRIHDAVRFGGTTGDPDGPATGDLDGPVTVVCHGHELPAGDGPVPDRYVCGHDHPTLAVEGRRHPCFLAGEGPDGADLLVLPAFNRLAPGATVNRARHGDFDSPLVADADALRPHVYDPDSQEVLAFPPLGECRSVL